MATNVPAESARTCAATLGDLHEIIWIGFAWDSDHPHAFTVGRRQYGDPYFDAECDDERST